MAGRTLPNVGLKGDFTNYTPGWGADVNTNFLKISVLMQGSVVSKVSSTPGSPTPGSVYIFDQTHTTQPNKIAVYDGPGGSETWTYITPSSGWVMYNQGAGYSEYFNGTVWQQQTAGSGWEIVFAPRDNEPPATNFATLDTRNSRPCLDFDDTVQETAIFSKILPFSYSGSGIRVTIYCAMTTATTGTVGWDISIERVDASNLDLDTDSFATAQTVTATTVPTVSGQILAMTVNISNGTSMDSLAAGEMFRLRIRRDVAADNAVGDAELFMVHMRAL